jgi:peptidylprolyl isomerase
MTHAKQWDTVQVHYKLNLDNGTRLVDTYTHEPLQFTVGANRFIPGFEQAVIGMEPGETKSVTILPDQAHGPHDETLVITAARAQLFPGAPSPKANQYSRIPNKTGQGTLVKILKVTERSVTIDRNHPLAGRDLELEILLVKIM